ncbi:MAG: copper homeostasis membrane protein CopD, partial [Hyphomicrobiaceae bacterium]
MIDPLSAIRATHLAATAITAGTVVFLVLVAGPAYRAAGADLAASGYRLRIVRTAAIGLATAVLSGAVWVVLQAARMSGRPPAAAIADGVLWTALTGTTFGIATIVRFGLALLL